MKRKRMIVFLLVVTTVLASSFTAFAGEKKETKEMPCEIIEEFTFEDFKDALDSDMTKEEIAKAKDLFDKAMELEKAEKVEAAEKVWDELFEMDIFDCEYMDYNFEDLKEEMKEDVSKADLAKAKDLFDKAMELEKSEKYEAAEKAWDELFEMDIFDYDEDLDIQCEN